MSEAEVYTHLADIFADVFPERTIHLHPELTANQVHGWDSSRHLNLILAVETTFSIRLALLEIDSIKTLGDLVGLVRVKTS